VSYQYNLSEVYFYLQCIKMLLAMQTHYIKLRFAMKWHQEIHYISWKT